MYLSCNPTRYKCYLYEVYIYISFILLNNKYFYKFPNSVIKMSLYFLKLFIFTNKSILSQKNY